MNRKQIAKRTGLIIGGVVVATAVVLSVEVYSAIHEPIAPFENPSRAPVILGQSGPPLRYLVLGDSTAAGQGAKYEHGIAIRTADYLANSHTVTMINLGVSGATVVDVVRQQLPEALGLRPDIVLLSVGSNDVTHFTSFEAVASDLTKILSSLASLPTHPKIIVTGSADLGSVPRFGQPLRSIAGYRTVQYNAVFERVCKSHEAIWADLSARTSKAFRTDQTLFASDRFHPNDRGYKVWSDVLVATMRSNGIGKRVK